jgi:hypothetical protein
MQQHDFYPLIHGKKIFFNMLEREDVIPRYKSHLLVIQKEHEDEKFKEIT